MPTLKDLRTAAGLSQNELANASGVSIEAIKKIETGKVERPHPATLRLLAAVVGQVPVVMNGSRDGPVFDPGMFDNARRDHAACLRIVGGILDGFVPLRQTTLQGTIVGPLAQLRLVQVFSYTRAECDRVLEATYRFPLPGDAAVIGVCVHFGEVVVQTSLAARADAERQYAAARDEGRQAALATRQSADVLTLQLAGLQPDQDVVVETTFVQAAAADSTGWQLRVPLTIGPRYARPDESGSPASHGQPLQVWRDPRHRFSLDLAIKRAASIGSSSHPLAVSPGTDGETDDVRLADDRVIPDRDLVLSWQPRRLETRPALDLITHEDLDEGMRYFLALVTPPETTRDWPGVDREVLLLVDRSGSMEGPKWDACRWAVRRFLAGLTATDRFNLGLFESHCTWLDSAAVAASDANRHRALAFLDRHAPTGGTELGPALEQALRSVPAPGPRARHLLLVTDAQVSDEARILQLVEGEHERADGRRLSVISIDSAPRGTFVRSLVEAGGGEAAFLTSDPSEEDITSALDRVLDTWARPLATNVELVVETGAATVQARHAAGVTRSRFPLGDLPAGRSLWVSGGVSLYSEPVVRLHANGSVLAEAVMRLDEAETGNAEVRRLFGARQIARLERLGAQAHDTDARDAILDELGYANDPLRAPGRRPVYAENARAEGSIVHKLLVRESLRFGLVCSATAFIGERVEAGRRVEASVQVPSALPAGWSEVFAVRALTAVPAPAARMRMPSARVGKRAAPSLDAAEARSAAAPAGPQAAPLAPATARVSAAGVTLTFRGTPRPVEAAVVLAQGTPGADGAARLGRLRARLANPRDLDAGIELWVCLDDPATALVRVRLGELLALGGERPLNVAVPAGASVQLVLWLGGAAWPATAGVLEVELG